MRVLFFCFPRIGRPHWMDGGGGVMVIHIYTINSYILSSSTAREGKKGN